VRSLNLERHPERIVGEDVGTHYAVVEDEAIDAIEPVGILSC
jgi:hypothetical protein